MFNTDSGYSIPATQLRLTFGVSDIIHGAILN
jgi:hypothetical protein